MFYAFDIYKDFRQVIRQRLTEAPDTPFFVMWDRQHREQTSILPAEFSRQVETVGAWLLKNGFHEKRIAIMGENSYWWVLVFFAVVTGGNTAVLLDKSASPETLRDLLARTGCSALFCSETYWDVAEGLKSSLPIDTFCLDSILQTAALSDSDLFREEYRRQTIDPDKASVICFTSGTSGEQKGVMLSQRNICESVSRSAMIFDYTGSTLLLLPLHHMYGLSAGIVGTMVFRGTVYINNSLRYLAQDLSATQPENLTVVPAMLPMLFSALSRIPHSPKLRLICGGAPVAQNQIDQFREMGIPLYVGYGMTECSPMIAIDSELFQRFDGSMYPVPGTEIRIENPDANGCGELLVKGPQVMQGYDQMPEQTAEVLKDGWLHTGDIGCMDEDGFIRITGRKKNLLILENGENISAESIEQKLMQIPGVTECLAFVQDGQLAAAIYAPDAEEAAVRDAVQTWNRTLPASHRITRMIFRSEEFRKNASHKIIRSID